MDLPDDWIRRGRYIPVALINFLVLTFFGLLLRFILLSPIPGANYLFLLHAHSHFAFAGWMFFSIAVLIVHSLSAHRYSSAYRNVFLVSLFSAFGMLVTFSFQGYKPLSIAFSTLFILVTYRFAYLVFKGGDLRGKTSDIAAKLISGSLLFLCLSSIGPFALGPLGAAGLRNTALYQNAIYFYLHFQMNGFMLLAALGLFASGYLTRKLDKNMRAWLYVFIFSALPVFFIFTLWDQPAAWVWLLALAGTSFTLLSWLKLCLYFRDEAKHFSFLVKASLIAITIKMVFQVLICIPVIGEWTFSSRNLVIGYIHLLTLACIMPLILDQFIKRRFLVQGRLLSMINGSFIATVVVYLALLFLQPLLALFSIVIPHSQLLLLIVSVFFLFIGFLYFSRLPLQRQAENFKQPIDRRQLAAEQLYEEGLDKL